MRCLLAVALMVSAGLAFGQSAFDQLKQASDPVMLGSDEGSSGAAGARFGENKGSYDAGSSANQPTASQQAGEAPSQQQTFPKTTPAGQPVIVIQNQNVNNVKADANSDGDGKKASKWSWLWSLLIGGAVGAVVGGLAAASGPVGIGIGVGFLIGGLAGLVVSLWNNRS
jgi:hypothetical protein